MVKPIAPKMYKFRVVRGPIGGCCNIDNRLVRVMSKFPYCIRTRVMKYVDCDLYNVSLKNVESTGTPLTLIFPKLIHKLENGIPARAKTRNATAFARTNIGIPT